MRFRTSLLCFCLLLAVFLVLPISASSQISPDPQIMAEVNQIKAVDNHTHVPKVVGTGEKDGDFDALPCDPLEPTEAPRMRSTSCAVIRKRKPAIRTTRECCLANV